MIENDGIEIHNIYYTQVSLSAKYSCQQRNALMMNVEGGLFLSKKRPFLL
jgi:hypothetical protein